MTYYGNKSSPLIGWSTSDDVWNLRASVFGGMPEHGHAYSMGARAGYRDTGDTGTVRLALYGTSGGNPSARRSYTNSINLNTYAPDAVSLTTYEADLLEAVPLSAGATYGLAALLHGGRMSLGQSTATGLMYSRDTSATTPPDPMGYTYSPTETKVAIWVNYEPNVSPDVPSNASPADGASFTDTTPTYAADFRDDNETLPNGLASDYLNAYQIQTRSVAADGATTGTIVWDSGIVAASGTEKTNRRFSKDHAGTALTPGQRYQWRSRVQDRFGAWSGYTDWTNGDFLVSGAAVVTLDGTPTGRTTDTTPDLQGRYHHVSSTSADRVQVRLYAGATLIKTSPEITKAVSSSALPGTLFTITAAESTFGTLASNASFSYQMRARASGVWSDWTAKRAFKTNGAPTTPANLQPASGLAVSTYPLITCQTTDPDNDALTVSARIKDSGGSLLFTRSMTYDAALYGGNGGYKYQTTGTDLATYATYKWDAQATDGDLTSAYSAESVIVYAQGPSVTVDLPTEAEVITTGTPAITWTTTDQQKKQVRVWRTSDDALAHDSGLIVDAVDAVYEIPDDILINNTDYYLTVAITDSAPLVGTSTVRNFRLEYIPPDPAVGFIASPDMAAMDLVPSVIRLSWDEVITIGPEFLYYRVFRRVAGVAFEAADRMVDLTSIEQTTWVDSTPPPNVDLIYSIVVVMRESLYDIVSSDPADSLVTLPLNGSVLSDVRDGLSVRAVFDHVDERREELVLDQSEVNTWDGGTPWLFEGPTEYIVIPMAARFIANDAATVEQQLDMLRALARRRTDGSVTICCYRDERGRKRFGRVRDLVITDQRLLRADVEFAFHELAYSDIPEAAG